MRFASWWHNQFPGKYCWADCVSWVFDWKRFNPFRIEKAGGCKIESETYPFNCYCGCWINGKCWDLLSEKEQHAIIAKRDGDNPSTDPFGPGGEGWLCKQ